MGRLSCCSRCRSSKLALQSDTLPSNLTLHRIDLAAQRVQTQTEGNVAGWWARLSTDRLRVLCLEAIARKQKDPHPSIISLGCA